MSSEPTKDTVKEIAVPPRYSKEWFVAESLEPERGRDRFDIVEKRLVRIEVDGFVWIKRGTVIAYRGDIKFRRERVLQTEGVHAQSGPVRSALKREIVPLAKAEGTGCLYVSDAGAHSQVVRLDGGSIYVVSTNLLAFEPTLEHEARIVGGVGLLAGGIIMIKLSGNGFVAISTKGGPLTMRVSPENPLSMDPTAVLAWTGGLWPELKTDVEVRSFAFHGGGAAIQMLFRGDGYVVLHARGRLEALRANLLKRVTSNLRKLLP